MCLSVVSALGSRHQDRIRRAKACVEGSACEHQKEGASAGRESPPTLWHSWHLWKEWGSRGQAAGAEDRQEEPHAAGQLWECFVWVIAVTTCLRCPLWAGLPRTPAPTLLTSSLGAVRRKCGFGTNTSVKTEDAILLTASFLLRRSKWHSSVAATISRIYTSTVFCAVPVQCIWNIWHLAKKDDICSDKRFFENEFCPDRFP